MIPQAPQGGDLPPPDDPENPRICYCMKVHLLTLRKAMEDGARTLSDLADATRAGTGCGTCRVDLLELLREDTQS